MRYLILLFCAVFAMAQQRLEPAACFALDSLSAEDRAVAERLLTRMLDSDALYTVTTSIKPFSIGFSYRLLPAGVGETDEELNAWRRIAPALRCGDEIESAVLPIGPAYRGKQFWQFVVLRRSAVRAAESAHLNYFSRYELDSSKGALALIQKVDRLPENLAAEAYGYLLGFPDYSVEFTRTARSLRRQHRYVSSGSYTIPTFDKKGLQFHWATPFGHRENDDDRLRKESAERVLEEYTKRRAQFIGDGHPGAAALLQDWFCNPEKGCVVPQ